MAGAFLALIVRADNFLPSKFLKLAWISLLIAVPLAFFIEALDARWVVFSLSAVASAAFVYLSLFSIQKWLRVGLMNRFVVYTGTISYGLYLLHKFSFGMVQALRLDRYPFLVVPVILLTSYALAAPLMASAREAIPWAKAIFRIEAGSQRWRGQPVRGRASLKETVVSAGHDHFGGRT